MNGGSNSKRPCDTVIIILLFAAAFNGHFKKLQVGLHLAQRRGATNAMSTDSIYPPVSESPAPAEVAETLHFDFPRSNIILRLCDPITSTCPGFTSSFIPRYFERPYETFKHSQCRQR